MTDMHWACPDCGHHLSIDEQGAGRQVRCTACGHAVTVPEVGTHWYCTVCHEKLGAAIQLVGKTVHCDKCGNEQTVPAPAKTTGAVKIDLSTFSKTKSDPQRATTLICPKCGAKLTLGATICSHCMYNVVSEKGTEDKKSATAGAHAPASPAAANLAGLGEKIKIGVLLLVILLALGGMARRHLQRTAKPETTTYTINLAYVEFTGFFDYFLSLHDALSGRETMANGFFLRNYALADMERLRHDPAATRSPVFPVVREMFAQVEDLHRVWLAAQENRLVRGGEAAELAKRHPQLATLVRGHGASAVLPPADALPVLQMKLAPTLDGVIQQMSQ